MNRPIRSRFSVGFILVLAFATGCASNARRLGVRPESIGAYRFSEHLGQDTDLGGIFVVEADTVSIDATPGPCWYDRVRSDALTFIYHCGDVTYAFDRSDPVSTARYSTTVHSQLTRSVCARTVVDSQGHTVCVEYRKESYFVDVPRSNVLRPQRLAEDDPSHP